MKMGFGKLFKFYLNFLKEIPVQSIKQSLKSKNAKVFACLFLAFVTVGFFLKSDALFAEVDGLYNEQADEIAGINALMSAVAGNDVNGVRFFSKAGRALVNQKNFGGATALHLACRENNFDIVKILVDAGADVNASDNEGWTPLMRAALAGNRNSIDLLLNKGAIASNMNSVGETAIIHATLSDCNDCLNSMFERFNFLKNMDVKLLKEQLSDAFVLARNRDNQVAQGILESYLDQVIKMAPLVLSSQIKEVSNPKAVEVATIPSKTFKITSVEEPAIIKTEPVKTIVPVIIAEPKSQESSPNPTIFVKSPQDQKVYKFMGYCKCSEVEKKPDPLAAISAPKKPQISEPISAQKNLYPNKKPEEVIFLIKKDEPSKNSVKPASSSTIFKFKQGESKKIAKIKVAELKLEPKPEPKPQTTFQKPIAPAALAAPEKAKEVSSKPASPAITPAISKPVDKIPAPLIPEGEISKTIIIDRVKN